jgi:hypothetical protein
MPFVKVLLTALIALSPVFASTPSLDPRTRDSLRYRLEDHFNELDLLVKNQRLEEKDLERQRVEMEELKVLERIPLEERIPELRKELAETAAEHGVKLARFERGGVSATAPVPRKISSDERYRLDPRSSAQQIRFTVIANGKPASIDSWIRSWPTHQMRLVELEKKESLGPSRFRILAHAFRFRSIEFPQIEILDPVRHLPAWARKDPKGFADTEPLLWGFIAQSRELAPRAKPLYANRRKFLLNSARMSFFLSKALPPQTIR